MFNGSRQAASTKASNKSDVAVGDVSKDDKDMDVDVVVDVDVDVEMWRCGRGQKERYHLHAMQAHRPQIQ